MAEGLAVGPGEGPADVRNNAVTYSRAWFDRLEQAIGARKRARSRTRAGRRDSLFLRTGPRSRGSVGMDFWGQALLDGGE